MYYRFKIPTIPASHLSAKDITNWLYANKMQAKVTENIDFLYVITQEKHVADKLYEEYNYSYSEYQDAMVEHKDPEAENAEPFSSFNQDWKKKTERFNDRTKNISLSSLKPPSTTNLITIDVSKSNKHGTHWDDLMSFIAVKLLGEHKILMDFGIKVVIEIIPKNKEIWNSTLEKFTVLNKLKENSYIFKFGKFVDMVEKYVSERDK